MSLCKSIPNSGKIIGTNLRGRSNKINRRAVDGIRESISIRIPDLRHCISPHTNNSTSRDMIRNTTTFDSYSVRELNTGLPLDTVVEGKQGKRGICGMRGSHVFACPGRCTGVLCSSTRWRGAGELLNFLLCQQLNLVCRRHPLLAQVKPRYLVSTFTDMNCSGCRHIENTRRNDTERSECPLRQYYTTKYTGVDGLARGHNE